MTTLSSAQISSVAAELLARTATLAATATKIPSIDYKGSGGTVSLRVPQPRTAKTQTVRGALIDMTDVDETACEVTLAMVYDAAVVDDEMFDLDITDFASQVLAPQIAAVVAACEARMAAALATVTPTIDGAIEAGILSIREALTDAGAPQANRFLACSSQVITAILGSERLSDLLVQDNTPGQPSALRDASIGRLYGLTVVESGDLEPGTAYGYHRSGIALASFAPSAPAAIGSSATSGGFAVAATKGYSPERLATLSVVSAFIGAAIVHDSTGGSDESDGEGEVLRVIGYELGS
jgi:hypothetical protein